MAQMRGLAQAIIREAAAVMDPNTPQKKVTPPGFLQMLINNAQLKILNLAGVEQGHARTIELRYMKRGTILDTSTTVGCDEGMENTYENTVLVHPLYRKQSIYISIADMQYFFTDATKLTTIGSPSVTFVTELFNQMLVQMNGLFEGIDKDLLTDMMTKFGVNTATGSNAPTPITFDVNDNLNLTDGIVKILDHASENEMNGGLLMVGSGIANRFNIASGFQVAANQNGYNGRPGWDGLSWFNDVYARQVWGANRFAIISPGSAGFVDWNMNEGIGALPMANSYYFTLPIPMTLANGTLVPLVLDCQLRELDCEVDIDGVSRRRGWILEYGKHFGLFTIPLDAYKPEDRLYQANGCLQFVAS